MNLGNVVVTGGMGFIGSHFVRLLMKGSEYRPDSLINIDYMGYGSDVRNLADIRVDPRYRFVEADINDIGAIKSIRDIDMLVNFAAETHVDRSIADPESFIHSNVKGVVSLLEYCRKKDVKTFVQVSTDEVYGDAEKVRAFDEDAPLKPTSPYSASKAAADVITRSYSSTYGLHAMITRSCNNFGPNQFPEKLLPKSIIRSLKGLPISIYGDGMQEREWLYVEDNTRAILQVILNGVPGEIYNISSSKGVSNLKIIDHIATILSSNFGINVLVEHVEDRPGHDRRYSIRTSKIRGLGWEQSYSLKKALELTVKWYVNNEDWWKSGIDKRVLSTQPWKIKWKKKEVRKGS